MDCTANTTLTAAHVKSAAQSQLLCVERSISQHRLQSLDTVSWWLAGQWCHWGLFKMLLFEEKMWIDVGEKGHISISTLSKSRAKAEKQQS